MKYSARRDLRQQLYTAYNTRAMGGEYDNRPVLIDIANTRLQIARLLGYSDYATYALRDKMAKNKETVNNFLSQLLEAYALAARSDVSLVKGFAVGYEQTNIDLQPYDWSYYSEKLKAAAYSVSDDAVRPYFELENVKKGIFGLATTLYGLTFTKNTQIQVYHPDVEAFEVRNSEGKLMAILYTDYHPRQGKRAGAWMTEFAGQWQQAGKDHRPLVSLVMNFTRPDGDTPALLTFDEAETFIHEFGHGLQAILSQCTYEGLSGTSVARDYVEMPSQIMENWLREKEFLNRFAFHYKTGEIMPDTLLKNIVNAANFNAGYLCYRQLGFALLDMAWHTIESPYSGEARSFEQKATAAAALLPVVQGTMTSPSFGHIFDGGYAAGYYGYKWSEMLDADAFAVFKKEGIFNKSTAERFRSAILSRGNTADPMILFKEFTGHAPTIDALLERTGVK
jgi:peptidyl-dipeptidase Dcp